MCDSDGRICAEFQLHGLVGDDLFNDRDDDGALAEPADLSLITDLLARFQWKSGDHV
jgi:hypothetical protein